MLSLKPFIPITIPFFAHDENGDAVTGLVDEDFTKRISKNGAAFSAMSITITEMENGWYSLPLSAADLNTEGMLSITLLAASIKQVNLQFKVDKGNALRINVATGAGVKSLTLDAGAPTTADFYNHDVVAIIAGTGAGQTRTIIDYSNGTRVIFIENAWATTPDTTSVFAIYPSGDFLFKVSRISNVEEDAINPTSFDPDVHDLLLTQAQTGSTNALNTYDPPTKAELDATQSAIESAISTISGMTPEEIKAALVEALTVDTYADPTTLPPNPASLKDQIGWVFARSIGVFIQDAVSQALRNRDDSATIAERTITASPTQAKLDEWQP